MRAAFQRYFEARRLLAMCGHMDGGWALEVGCGRGIGVELIFDLFGADRVDAFDLDPRMVDLARRRLARFGDRVMLTTGGLFLHGGGLQGTHPEEDYFDCKCFRDGLTDAGFEVFAMSVLWG